MTLNQYLSDEGIDDQAFAKLLRCDRSTIYRIRKCGQRPSPALMKKIALATDGKVQPNDFYGLAA
jgi:hypothetical protein